MDGPHSRAGYPVTAPNSACSRYPSSRRRGSGTAFRNAATSAPVGCIAAVSAIVQVPQGMPTLARRPCRPYTRPMTQPPAPQLPPDLAAIEGMARAAIARLPVAYRAAAAAVALRVEDFPSDAMLDDLGAEDAFEVTGLYEGVPLTEKSVADQPQGPDVIWLFRRPILDEWCERGDVAIGDLVAHVLVHELAHHFGWTDDQIAAIDRWWE